VDNMLGFDASFDQILGDPRFDAILLDMNFVVAEGNINDVTPHSLASIPAYLHEGAAPVKVVKYWVETNLAMGRGELCIQLNYFFDDSRIFSIYNHFWISTFCRSMMIDRRRICRRDRR
jgi:hypothetical protein